LGKRLQLSIIGDSFKRAEVLKLLHTPCLILSLSLSFALSLSLYLSLSLSLALSLSLSSLSLLSLLLSPLSTTSPPPPPYFFSPPLLSFTPSFFPPLFHSLFLSFEQDRSCVQLFLLM